MSFLARVPAFSSGSYVNPLPGGYAYSTAISPADVRVELRVMANGEIRGVRLLGTGGGFQHFWRLGTPSGNDWVRFSRQGSDSWDAPNIGVALNTWYQLNTDRMIGYLITGNYGFSEDYFKIEISNDGGSTIVASSGFTYHLYAELIDPGP